MWMIAKAMAILIALFLSSLAAAAPQMPTNEPVGGELFGHSVKDLGNGLHVFRWWIYRNIFLVTDDGVIVTDPMNPKAAKLLQAEIRNVTDKPVKGEMDAGTHNPDELSKKVRLPEYENWRAYDDWLPMNVERIWAYYLMGW